MKRHHPGRAIAQTFYSRALRNWIVSEDRAIDRTATGVFFIGDRLYDTITAFVSGAGADRYTFTSALPLQILRILGPTFEGLLAVAAPAEP